MQRSEYLGGDSVTYRIGSLEMMKTFRMPYLFVICRVGSLESKVFMKLCSVLVICRVGSLFV